MFTKENLPTAPVSKPSTLRRTTRVTRRPSSSPSLEIPDQLEPALPDDSPTLPPMEWERRSVPTLKLNIPSQQPRQAGSSPRSKSINVRTTTDIETMDSRRAMLDPANVVDSPASLTSAAQAGHVTHSELFAQIKVTPEIVLPFHSH